MAKRRSKPTQDQGLPDRTVFFEELSGGVDLVTSPTLIREDRAQELLNFSVQEPGVLRTVEGYELFTDTALTPAGTDRIQGGERIYLHTGPVTRVAFEGNIHACSDAGVFGASLKAGLDTNNEIYFPYNQEVVIAVDGATQPQISADGNTWYACGIVAPTVAPTLDTSSGGSLIDANTYEVSYTWGTTAAIDTHLVHESDDSPVATQLTATPNLTIDVTGPSSADPKVNRVYVYARNTTTGQSTRRLVDNVADGGTWAATLALEPSELAAAVPTNRDIPGFFKFMVFHRNRWWGFDPTVPNRLWFSEVFQPQSWPSNYFVDISMSRGDELSSAVALGDLLIVYGQTSIYILSGDTVFEINVSRALSVETGAFGPRAALVTEAGVIHAGIGGVYLFNGATDQPFTDPIDTGWLDLIRNATATQMSRIAVAYLPTNKQVLVSVPRLYPTGAAGEYVLDLIRTRQVQQATGFVAASFHSVWFRTDRAIGGYLPWSGNEPTTGNHGRLFSWPTTLGTLTEERTGTDANGGDLTAIYKTPAHHTSFRETMLVHGFVEYLPSSGNLTVDLYVNDNLVSTQTLDVSASVATYGSAVYSLDSYGGPGRRRQPLMFPLPADGTEFFLTFTYVGQNAFKLYSYGIGSIPEPVLRTL